MNSAFGHKAQLQFFAIARLCVYIYVHVNLTIPGKILFKLKYFLS